MAAETIHLEVCQLHVSRTDDRPLSPNNFFYPHRGAGGGWGGMVDPLTLSLFITGMTSMLMIASQSTDWWRSRFKLFATIDYPVHCAEYAKLWAVMTHAKHVASPHVKRCAKRSPQPDYYQPAWTISGVAKFIYRSRTTIRLAHGRDEDGHPCVHLMCFWKSDLNHMHEALQAEDECFRPDDFVLVDWSRM